MKRYQKGAGGLAYAAGVIVRMLNMLRGRYYRLRDASPVLQDEEQLQRADIIAALDYLAESGYIKIRLIAERRAAEAAEAPLENLEIKLLPKGVRLAAGYEADALVRP